MIKYRLRLTNLEMMITKFTIEVSEYYPKTL